MTAADTAVTLYRDFMSSLACGSALTDEHVGAWGTLERAVNQLDAASRRTVHGIVSNVLQHGGAYVAIERMSNDGIEDLEKSLRSLVLGGAGESRKRQCPIVSRRQRFGNKRPKQHLEVSMSPPVTADSLDPVRKYFIDNISNPYPSPSEKDRLCKVAKISRRKLESDLTNWRRRSEWTEIMNTYCNGDKGLMQRMIEDVESGKDVGDEIRGRYDRMRAYLEKRDEQAGEWVAEIEEMIRTGEIDRPNLPSGYDRFPVALYTHTRGDARFEELSDDEGEGEEEDADADGESDEERTPSLVEVDVSLQAPAEVPSRPALFTTSPLPSFTSSHSSSSTTPSPVQLTGRPIWTTGPTPAKGKRAASNQSSYSSLSAVSQLAAQAHSRSTSGTTGSTRSVSSSSTSSAPGIAIDPRLEMLKRPAQQESFTRSSRSRVEDLLTEEPAEWVAGHAPGEGFHIGADPSLIHYTNGPAAFEMPTDVTPYLMAPDAWSTTTPFHFLPHVTQPTAGEFSMPPSYEFTFGQEMVQVPVSTTAE